MSSSSSPSSSNSYDSRLVEQRATLIAQKNQLAKEIKQSKAMIDQYETNLQLAHQAFSFAESSFNGRTKKLASIFGGILKSDEELCDKIQSLMKQAEDDEAKAVELRQQIDEFNLARTHQEDEISNVQNILKQQNNKISQKQAQLNDKQKELDAINNELIQEQKKKSKVIEYYSPLSAAVNAKISDQDFFSKLHAQATSLTPAVDESLKDLAAVAHVPVTSKNINVKQLLDSVACVYEKLADRVKEQDELEKSVVQKINKIKRKTEDKQKKSMEICQSIKTTETTFEERRQNIIEENENKLAAAKEKAKEMQNKELSHYRKIILMTNPNASVKSLHLDDAIDLENNEILKLVQTLQNKREELIEKKKKASMNIEKGIDAMSKAADTISKANRKLMHGLRNT